MQERWYNYATEIKGNKGLTMHEYKEDDQKRNATVNILKE